MEKMGDYETIDFFKPTDTIRIQNGGPYQLQQHQHTGQENPAFRANGPFTITSGNLGNGQVATGSTANHLIYDTTRGKKPNLDNSDLLADFYSSTSRSEKYLSPYATMPRNPSILGASTRSRDSDRDWGRSQTLGRSLVNTSSARHRPQFFSTISKRGWPTINTRTIGKERKEDCISFFDLELDKVSSYQYRPCEEITGAIKLFVRKSLEIRYLELIVTGVGHVTVRRASDGVPHTKTETYLRKQKCVLGSDTSSWGSVLTPGHYTSKFRIKLPENLPSTLRHKDDSNGFGFDVTYTLKVRLCDDVGVPRQKARSHARKAKVRVFLEKVIPFNIQRSFDLSTIPDALCAVTHTERIYLSCTHTDAAIVCVTTDRAVFLAGDSVRLKVQVTLPNSQRVKEITCCLLQLVTIDSKHSPLDFPVSRITLEDPRQVNEGSGQDRKTNATPTNNNNGNNSSNYEITIPTSMQLVSPYSLGGSHVKLEYCLDIVLRFSPAGGKLSFRVPVDVGPCAEPIYAEKISSSKAIPLFHPQITRFPSFAKWLVPSEQPARPPTPRSTASVNVTTKYTNSVFARCFLCCFGMAE